MSDSLSKPEEELSSAPGRDLLAGAAEAGERRCPLCCCEQSEPHLCAPRLDRLDGETHTYRRCERCGFVFLSPVTSSTDDSYDQSGYYSKKRPLLRGPIELAARGFSRLRLALVERAWRRPPGRLLDIGCGKGRFLADARSAGWECVGLEPTTRSRRFAIDAYGLDVIPEPVQAARIEPESFDVITMWHSLEHLQDPLGAMESAYRWLNPGGLVAVAVPNAASWQAKFGGEVWFHLDPPRHMSQFTTTSVSQLVDCCGFRDLTATFFFPELNDLGMIQTVLNRAGFSPNFLFSLLKRNKAGLPPTRVGLALNTAGVAGVLAISWPLLIMAARLEEAFGRGGTLVATARKPADDHGA